MDVTGVVPAYDMHSQLNAELPANGYHRVVVNSNTREGKGREGKEREG